MKKFIRKIDSSGYSLVLFLEQEFSNVGLYTPTNGDIGQIDSVCNFVIQTDENNTQVTIKDGVDVDRYGFLNGLQYNIEWGDGSEDIFDIDGVIHTHIYGSNGVYDITMTIITPWGRHKNVKKITIPSTSTITFDTSVTTPELLGYDSELIGYMNTSGVIICQGGLSRVSEVKKYGTNGYQASISDSEGMSGINGISQITNSTVTYYIDRVKYMDDLDTGLTTISLYPNHFTNGDIVNGIEYIHELLNLIDQPMVHQEQFNGITGDIEIQSDIFINRGKQAPFEFYYKMGEISNMKELEQNGNKFFTINNSDDFKL